MRRPPCRSVSPHRFLALLSGIFLLSGIARSEESQAEKLLAKFLHAQTERETLYATFTQTKIVPTLAHPQETQGQLWLAKGGKFRMQCGSPPLTVMVSNGEEIVGVSKTRLGYMKKKLSLDDPEVRSLTSLFTAGENQALAQLREEFEIQKLGPGTPQPQQITLVPKSTKLKKSIQHLRLELSPDGLQLLSFEVVDLHQGKLRMKLNEIMENPAIGPEAFDPTWGIPEAQWRK